MGKRVLTSAFGSRPSRSNARRRSETLIAGVVGRVREGALEGTPLRRMRGLWTELGEGGIVGARRGGA